MKGLAIERRGSGGRAGPVLLPHLRISILIIFEQSSFRRVFRRTEGYRRHSKTTRGVVSASDGTVRRPAALRRRGRVRRVQGPGRDAAALQISAFTVLLNIVLNGPFIRKFGVAGAAHATSISALAATLVALWRLSLRRVRFSRSPKPDVKTIKQITRVGGPIGVSGTIFTLIYVILGRQLSALQGGAALAALAVGHRIEAVPTRSRRLRRRRRGGRRPVARRRE